MVDPIKNISSPSTSSSSILTQVKNKITSYTTPSHQTDYITMPEKERQFTLSKIKDLKKETATQSEIFIKKASLFTIIKTSQVFCNNGQESKDDTDKCRLALKDLSDIKNPGFFSIVTAMKNYFPELSTIKMFFLYFICLRWIPEFYFRLSLEKIIDFSRSILKEGDNLPVLGRKLLGTANSYLADYNRTVQRFGDDPHYPSADRDKYIRQELKKPEMLGYPSVEELHKSFAKATSREDIRPSFRSLSNPIRTFQFLDFDFLKNKKNHLTLIRNILLPFTYIICFIPYYLARITEYIPNKIIKSVHRFIINFFMPTVIQSTLESVSQPAFTYAINRSLCPLIEDFLLEMKKKPEDRSIEETPNIVDDNLNNDIKTFSELAYTLLKHEPYKRQEQLEYLKRHGPGVIDKSIITPIFIAVLHTGIVECFNALLAKPEKLEKYLCNLIESLNNIFDYTPDPTSDDGKALSAHMEYTKKQRQSLLNKIIKQGINLATEDKMNNLMTKISCGTVPMLSRNQKENIIIAYRKIKKNVSDHLPDIAHDAGDILNSSSYLHPTSAQTIYAKEDIQRTIRDLERLFISINNLIPVEDCPAKSQMIKHLKPLLQNEKMLKDSIIRINQLHEKKDGLKLIKTELEGLNKIIESFSSKKISALETHLSRLNEINKNHQFDLIIVKYKKLEDQLKKITDHKIFSNKIEEIMSTTFFSNNFCHNMAKAQKEYLLNPNDKNKEKILVSFRQKMQNFIKDLEGSSFSNDVIEIKQALKRILEAQHIDLLEEAYRSALSVIRKKIAKHKSLNHDEQEVLPRYFEECKINIDLYLAEFPERTKTVHSELIKYAEILTSTIKQMQTSLENIGKHSFIESLDFTAIIKLLGSIGSFFAGYTGFIGKSLSIAIGSTAATSTIIPPTTPLIWTGKSLARAIGVPLAEKAVNSTYNIITNQTFYEGLIHAYMRQFIDFTESKERL